MEALDRSFSTSSDASLAMYPISPEPRYNECLSPQYSPIQYDEQLYDLPSPCTGVTPESSIDSAYMSSVSSRTPLSSTSSFSSDSNHNCLSSSHSSGLSEIPSLSSMSISSSEDSSSSSLFLNSSLSDTSISNNNNIINNNNPFNVVQTRSNKYKSRKNNTATVVNSNTNCSNSTQRRSSAPARGNSGSKNSDNPRKDSFVYDVQLEADNVLLFVPDLVSFELKPVGTFCNLYGIYYASPTSGEAYRDRRLTTNFEL